MGGGGEDGEDASKTGKWVNLSVAWIAVAIVSVPPLACWKKTTSRAKKANGPHCFSFIIHFSFASVLYAEDGYGRTLQRQSIVRGKGVDVGVGEDMAARV